MNLRFRTMAPRWISSVALVLIVAFLQQATAASVRNATKTTVKPAFNKSRFYAKVTSTSTTEVMPVELDLDALTQESDPTNNIHSKRQANYGRFYIMDPRQMHPYIPHQDEPAVRFKKETKSYPNAKCSNCKTIPKNQNVDSDVESNPIYPNANCPNCQPGNPSYPNPDCPNCQANATRQPERRKAPSSRKSSSYLTTFLLRQLKDTNNNMNRLLECLTKNYPVSPLPPRPFVGPNLEEVDDYTVPLKPYELVSPWRGCYRPLPTVNNEDQGDQDAYDDNEEEDEEYDQQKKIASEELDINRYSSAKRFPSVSVEMEEVESVKCKKSVPQQQQQQQILGARSVRANRNKKPCTSGCNEGRRCLLCQNVPTFEEGR